MCEHAMEDICGTKLLLERYMSPNFFGLFVEKEQEGLLKKLTQDLCKEIRKLGVKADPIIKSFHLTLAYQFPPKHFSPLEDLAREIAVPVGRSPWELRLYSYDSRTAGCDVYKVLYAHVAREPDELELLIGDFVFVTQEEVAKTTDGWVVGISWLTGATGYLPTNYVERTAETNAWTLHTVFPFSKEVVEAHEGEQPSSLERLVDSQRERLVENQREGNDPGGVSVPDLEVESLYARVVRHSGEGVGQDQRVKEEDTSPPQPRPQGPRQVFIARHGERVDFTFGLWIPYSFDKDGKYKRKDLNMPKSVPQRRDGPDGFSRDCPLTVIGETQARMVGEAMKEAGVHIHHVFCSPSLRCVQTCHNILTGLGIQDRVKMNIEPGLFEWLAWYQSSSSSLSYSSLSSFSSKSSSLSSSFSSSSSSWPGTKTRCQVGCPLPSSLQPATTWSLNTNLI